MRVGSESKVLKMTETLKTKEEVKFPVYLHEYHL